MIRPLVALCCVLSLVACKEEIEGESLGLLDLSVYGAAGANPYVDVAFVRIAVTSDKGQVVNDKFVRIEEAASAALEAIPFGANLKITLEGWSKNDQGLIGQLISRGRSTPFTVHEDSQPQLLPVMMSRVNAFGLTSRRLEDGSSQATNLVRGRVGHTVTLLPNGTVLIIGGGRSTAQGDVTGPSDLSEVYRSVEVYDPLTGVWTEYPEGLSVARAFHTTTTMSDGRVVVAGGVTDAAGSVLGSIEIFDPAVGGSFTPDSAAALSTPRAAHTASLIEGGDHLVLGGGFTTSAGTVAALKTVEVICVTGAPCQQQETGAGVVFVGELLYPRFFHTANRVAVGPNRTEAVVFIGGEGDQGIVDGLETFQLNPAGVSEHRPVMVGGARTRHTATFVPSQNFIHVVGGFSDKPHETGVQRIDSYDVTQEVFQTEQEFYALQPRGGHAAVAMPGNAILLFGGFNAGQPLNSAEVIFEYYDQASNQKFIDRGGVSPMSQPRGACRGVLLTNDTVLVVGGQGPGTQPNTIGEFFNPL